MNSVRSFPERRAGIAASDVLGALLILLALAIPSAAWIHFLRVTSSGVEKELLQGAFLFRIAIGTLGLFVLIRSRAGEWHRTLIDNQVKDDLLSSVKDPVLFVIVIFATVLRLYRLNQGLWQDEVLTLVDYARSPFGEIITTFQSQNQHFLYSILTHASFLLFGESVWALRLPAVLFGIAGLWVLYVFARLSTNRLESLLSVALVGVSYHHIWFSQDARGYTGLLFWTLLSSWLLIRAVKQPGSGLWFYYALSASLGIYTNNSMVFVVGGQFITYLLVSPNRKILRAVWFWDGFVLAGLLTFVLHAFALPQMIGAPLADLSPVAAWRNPLWGMNEMIHGLSLGAGGWIALLIGLFIFAVGSMNYLRRNSIVFFLFVLPVVLTALITILIGHPLWPRLFFFALGFGAMIIVRGIFVSTSLISGWFGWTEKSQTRLAVAMLVCALLVSSTSLRYVYRPKQDYAGARDFVNISRQKGDAVVALGLAQYPYKLYFAPDWLVAQNLKELNSILAHGKRTWAIFTFPLYMQSVHPDMLSKIDSDFRLVRSFDGSVEGGTVYVYLSRQEILRP